ncbi:MAG TPA: DUF2336 domain-containing protein [Pseudolabrys sp.]|nr:DUF2336 domain-containing protein [Pseudolabrys sp.]
MQERSFIAELEGTLATGTPGRQADILRRVTDLFLARASQYSEEQVDLFDGVISRIAERIETKARVELAHRLAPVDNAPPMIVRRLARDEAIEVAGPILTRSPRLTDEDLVAIANDTSQDRLLAISKRASISESVSDTLVTRGDREVVLSVAQNEGARFSDSGYGKLIDRSIDDEVLAICVGMRKDIPREHFHSLIAKASEVVFARLAAANPEAVREVQQVLTGITGQDVVTRAQGGRDRRADMVQFESAVRTGQSADALVSAYASSGKFDETVAALASLSRTAVDLVEHVMNDRRGDNDFVLLLAKAAGLSWPAALQVCILRRGPGGLPPLGIEAARRNYERLQAATAQRVIQFYNERNKAVGDFTQLAQQMRIGAM